MVTPHVAAAATSLPSGCTASPVQPWLSGGTAAAVHTPTKPVPLPPRTPVSCHGLGAPLASTGLPCPPQVKQLRVVPTSAQRQRQQQEDEEGDGLSSGSSACGARTSDAVVSSSGEPECKPSAASAGLHHHQQQEECCFPLLLLPSRQEGSGTLPPASLQLAQPASPSASLDAPTPREPASPTTATAASSDGCSAVEQQQQQQRTPPPPAGLPLGMEGSVSLAEFLQGPQQQQQAEEEASLLFSSSPSLRPDLSPCPLPPLLLLLDDSQPAAGPGRRSGGGTLAAPAQGAPALLPALPALPCRAAAGSRGAAEGGGFSSAALLPLTSQPSLPGSPAATCQPSLPCLPASPARTAPRASGAHARCGRGMGQLHELLSGDSWHLPPAAAATTASGSADSGGDPAHTTPAGMVLCSDLLLCSDSDDESPADGGWDVQHCMWGWAWGGAWDVQRFMWGWGRGWGGMDVPCRRMWVPCSGCRGWCVCRWCRGGRRPGHMTGFSLQGTSTAQHSKSKHKTPSPAQPRTTWISLCLPKLTALSPWALPPCPAPIAAVMTAGGTRRLGLLPADPIPCSCSPAASLSAASAPSARCPAPADPQAATAVAAAAPSRAAGPGVGAAAARSPALARFLELLRSSSTAFEAEGRVLRLRQYLRPDVGPEVRAWVPALTDQLSRLLLLLRPRPDVGSTAWAARWWWAGHPTRSASAHFLLPAPTPLMPCPPLPRPAPAPRRRSLTRCWRPWSPTRGWRWCTCRLLSRGWATPSSTGF